MRITLLSIFALLCLLATCVCPCLVDSASGQVGDTTHINNDGTFSMMFQVEQVELETHNGGAKPNGAVDLYDRAAGSRRNQTIYYFAKSTEGKKGLNAVNVKVVMTGPDGPWVQDLTIRPEGLGQTNASGGGGAVDHNSTRSNRGISGEGGDDDAQLKQGNDKIVRKKPGRTQNDDTDGDLKQGNDKIVRKRPGRTTYATIKLSSYDDGSDLASWDNGVEKGMINLDTGSSVILYDMDGEVAAATAIEYGLIAALLGGQPATALGRWENVEDPLAAISDQRAIEYALIAALLRSSGSEGDLHVQYEGNQTSMINLATSSAVVVEQHEIRDPGR